VSPGCAVKGVGIVVLVGIALISRVFGAGGASLPVQLAITTTAARSAEVHRMAAQRTRGSVKQHLRPPSFRKRHGE
jgi:hypothetical protein